MANNTMAMEAAREFLGQVCVLRDSIENKKLRIEALRDMAMSTTAKVSDMPRSDSPNLQRMEAMLCKAADLEREIVADQAAMESAREEVTAAVCDLPDYREQQVLFHRYVECLTWAAVSVECGCHVRTAHRYHDSGVEHMAEILWKKLSPQNHPNNT